MSIVSVGGQLGRTQDLFKYKVSKCCSDRNLFRINQTIHTKKKNIVPFLVVNNLIISSFQYFQTNLNEMQLSLKNADSQHDMNSLGTF